jgi:hypothetical protein
MSTTTGGWIRQNRVNEVSFGSFVPHLVTVIASLK